MFSTPATPLIPIEVAQLDTKPKPARLEIALPPSPPSSAGPSSPRVSARLVPPVDQSSPRPQVQSAGANAPEYSGYAGAHVLTASASSPIEIQDLGLTEQKLLNATKVQLREILCPWHDEITPQRSALASTSTNASGSSSSVVRRTQVPRSEPCDARLGSWRLLQKHLEVHLDRAESAAGTRVSPSEEKLDFVNHRCGWEGCTTQGYLVKHQLRIHCFHAHLRELQEDFCVFKDCEDPVCKDGRSFRSHYTWPDHPRVWQQEHLRPQPSHVARNIQPPAPPPIPPDLTWHPEPYLSTVSPYRGLQVPAITVRPLSRLKRRAGSPVPSSPPPPLAPAIRELIVPTREIHDFWPVCNDAATGEVHASSSSIFRPSALAQDYDDLEIIIGRKVHLLGDVLHGIKRPLRVASGQRIPPMIVPCLASTTVFVPKAEPMPDPHVSPLDNLTPPGPCSVSTTPLVPRPRPSRSYDKIGQAATFYIEHAEKLKQARIKRKREEEDARDRADPTRKGKEKMRDDCNTELPLPRLESDAIERASIRRATKIAKQSYGVRFWEERWKFEGRGKELGELSE